ncbi:MAG: hypothetical protein KDD36_07790 [Flavobacteriales bacterium]|nr:hypothetical protein [Flavobacteriales bacterium]
MKKLAIHTFFLFALSGAYASLPDSTEIQKAKALALKVDASINRYDIKKAVLFKKEIEPELKSFHNLTTSLVDAVYDENELLKLTVQSEGDMEVLISEYYFLNGTLYLVTKELNVYDKPLMENGTLLRRKRFLYYLKEGQLQACLYNDNILINYSETEVNVKGQELVQESEEYTHSVSP